MDRGNAEKSQGRSTRGGVVALRRVNPEAEYRRRGLEGDTSSLKHPPSPSPLAWENLLCASAEPAANSIPPEPEQSLIPDRVDHLAVDRVERLGIELGDLALDPRVVTGVGVRNEI